MAETSGYANLENVNTKSIGSDVRGGMGSHCNAPCIALVVSMVFGGL